MSCLPYRTRFERVWFEALLGDWRFFSVASSLNIALLPPLLQKVAA